MECSVEKCNSIFKNAQSLVSVKQFDSPEASTEPYFLKTVPAFPIASPSPQIPPIDSLMFTIAEPQLYLLLQIHLSIYSLSRQPFPPLF